MKPKFRELEKRLRGKVAFGKVDTSRYQQLSKANRKNLTELFSVEMYSMLRMLDVISPSILKIL